MENKLMNDEELTNVAGGTNEQTNILFKKGATYKKRSAGQFARLGYEFYARVTSIKNNIVGCDYGMKYPESNDINNRSYLSVTFDEFTNDFDTSQEITYINWN